MVDHAAMDVFAQYETQGLNPVPAILADTLLTLEACELRTLFPDPLRDFGRIKVKRQEAREWKKELADIQDNKIAWTCPWYSLMRLYSAAGSEPHGGMSKGKEMTNWGKPRVSASQEYNEWRRARGVPEYVLREAPHAEGSSRSSDETLKAMASELERARAQIKQLEEVEEAAKWEIDALKRQCKKKDEQIEHLKIQGEELARRLGEAEDEIDRNPEIQLPPKTARRLKESNGPFYGLPPGYVPPVLTNPPDSHAPATNLILKAKCLKESNGPLMASHRVMPPPQLTNPQDNNTTAANHDPQNQAHNWIRVKPLMKPQHHHHHSPPSCLIPFLPTTKHPFKHFSTTKLQPGFPGKPIIPQPVPLLVSTTQPKGYGGK
ncbi:hypothetical protein SESBI_49709 [Sesbania bispinosa]|nr:hypothetical protein SESBI_49709 [Sesbania bispinosa]